MWPIFGDKPLWVGEKHKPMAIYMGYEISKVDCANFQKKLYCINFSAKTVLLHFRQKNVRIKADKEKKRTCTHHLVKI